MTDYEGRVYVMVSGGWAWAILDERRVEIMRGAGYENQGGGAGFA